MIARPLELASKLRPEPRSFDSLFYVNAGLLVLFFSLFGSRFVLAPGLNLELPQIVGARKGGSPATHHISVTGSGQGVIFSATGPVDLKQLKVWLKEEAKKTPHPVLLVRASANVTLGQQSEIASAAAEAGFGIILAAEEPAGGANGGR